MADQDRCEVSLGMDNGYGMEVALACDLPAGHLSEEAEQLPDGSFRTTWTSLTHHSPAGFWWLECTKKHNHPG